jgi:hypothetical protein
MKKYLLAIVLGLMAINSYAGGTGYQIPKYLHVYSQDGSVFFKHEASTCNGDDIFQLKPQHPAYHVMYSMLMEAYKSQLPIKIRYIECRSDGIRPVVEGIYFE